MWEPPLDPTRWGRQSPFVRGHILSRVSRKGGLSAQTRLRRRPSPAFLPRVVGDNLANSFDSRTPEFGPVRADMIRGKPLYLYWSPDLHRIGCTLR